MKRFLVVLLAAATVWVSCGVTFADGFLGSMAPSNIGFLPIFGPGGIRGARCEPGWGILGKPQVYLGRLEQSVGSTWTLERSNSIATASWPLRGYWLGATTELAPIDNVGLLVAGSIFFPQREAGTWRPEPGGAVYDFRIPSHDWWSLDGLARIRVAGGFDALAGFRWDHTSVRVDYVDNTSDDYILNAYLPLIGMQLDQRFFRGSLLFRVVGTPLLAGRMRYHYWDRVGYAEFGDFDVSKGYFAEVFAHYSLKLSSDVNAGAFAKWNSLHVKTAEENLLGSIDDPVSWAVDIRSWTIGLNLSVGFYSPI